MILVWARLGAERPVARFADFVEIPVTALHSSLRAGPIR
jgi:hypothetical protein